MKTYSDTKNNIRVFRDPIMVGPWRLFGHILPYIAFEDVEMDVADLDLSDEEFEIDPNVKSVRGSFFTLEWFGRGISYGGFRIPLKDDD